MPELKAVQAAFPNCLVMIGVALYGTTESLKTFRTDFGITWTLAIDTSGSVATAYGITGVPHTFVIDINGWIQKDYSGYHSGIGNEIIAFIQTLAPCPTYMTIESCDSAGAKKDTFQPSDEVYATGTGYAASTTYDVYLVNDVTWTEGMAIPARVPGTTTSISSDASGNVPATLLWSNPLTPGKYDIVVDADHDGVYHAASDALDDNDIEVTAGFFVIPEFNLGTILGSIVFITAFGMFLMHKRKRW